MLAVKNYWNKKFARLDCDRGRKRNDDRNVPVRPVCASQRQQITSTRWPRNIRIYCPILIKYEAVKLNKGIILNRHTLSFIV